MWLSPGDTTTSGAISAGDHSVTGMSNITQTFNVTFLAKDEQLRYLLPEMALLLVIVTSNFIVLSVIYKSRMWSRGQNSFIVHLVVVHLLRAGYSFAMDFYYLSITMPSPVVCRILASLTVFFGSVDAHAVSLLFFDRLLFVSAPGSHRTRMTRSVTVFLCLYNILQGILVSAAPHIFSWVDYDFIPYLGECAVSKDSHVVFLIFLPAWTCFVPLMTTSVCFWRNFFVTKQRTSQVHVQIGPMACSNSITALEVSLQATFKILCIIYIIFLASWIPYCILQLNYASHESYKISSYFVCQTLTLTGGAINPWLYGMYNRRFRRTLKHMLFCLWDNGGHRVTHHPPATDLSGRINAVQPHNTVNGAPSQPYTISHNQTVRHPNNSPRGRSESLIGLYNYPLDTGINRASRNSIRAVRRNRRLHQNAKPPRQRMQATCSRNSPNNMFSLGPDMISLSISN